TPWYRSITPLSSGRRGGLAATPTPNPASQQARSVGRSPCEPPGMPLSTRSRSGRAPRANNPRRTARVARGCTWPHPARGETRRPQDGPAGLVDAPQPADLRAVAQRDPLGGVDLPGLVRRGGPGPRPRRPAAAGGRAQAGVAEPAAEGGGARRGELGPAGAEGDADQLGPPARVLAAEGQRGLADRGGVGVGQPSGDAV